MKSYFEIFEILVKSLKSCEISLDFEISYVILPRCGPLDSNRLCPDFTLSFTRLSVFGKVYQFCDQVLCFCPNVIVPCVRMYVRLYVCY